MYVGLAHSHSLVQSGEGIGKSTAISGHLPREQFEDWTQGSEEFACMSFRSRAQAEDKAKEFQAQQLRS